MRHLPAQQAGAGDEDVRELSDLGSSSGAQESGKGVTMSDTTGKVKPLDRLCNAHREYLLQSALNHKRRAGKGFV